MPSIQLIDKLLQTPLFQGISKADLHEIVGNTKFGFSKYDEGKTIVKVDSVCNSMLFLLNGKVEVITTSADHSYIFTEVLSAPLQIQPQRLFGLHQRYTATFKAHTDCSFMTISKSEVVKLYSNYDVFRINIINLFSTQIQKLDDRTWASQGKTLRSRIIRFFTIHCSRPAGEKTIKIKMNNLAEILNDSRLNISIELNKMQEEGLLVLSRGMIKIPALEAMFGLTANPANKQT